MIGLAIAAAAAPDKVITLAHYRREAASALDPRTPAPTFTSADKVALMAWFRQAIDPQTITQEQVRHVVDVLLRQVLACNAVFGPVYIDLGGAQRLVCTMEFGSGDVA